MGGEGQMIRDRGNIKWVSLMLPEHVQQLKEFARTTEKVSKPLVDEQMYERFDEMIAEALMNEQTLHFSYYKNGEMKTVQGIVNNVDVLEKQLQIITEDTTSYELKLENIVSVDHVDEV